MSLKSTLAVAVLAATFGTACGPAASGRYAGRSIGIDPNAIIGSGLAAIIQGHSPQNQPAYGSDVRVGDRVADPGQMGIATAVLPVNGRLLKTEIDCQAGKGFAQTPDGKIEVLTFRSGESNPQIRKAAEACHAANSPLQLTPAP